MTEPYLGEIQLFGFDFNPVGWALCNGATLPVSQNTALFSLIGVTYGGTGSSTFQLPNFCARAGCEQGQGGGLSDRQLGNAFGSATVALLTTQIPSHQHSITAYSQSDPSKKSGMPANGVALSSLGSSAARPFVTVAQPDTQFSPTALMPTGSELPHQNQQPYLAVNFCIALSGDYPVFD
ncbi:phage tail protein [Xanthomonas vesicatoria]|uniref:phage tail protein n=1 Tax=Xanthomonas vesicatoria TaxID=56460 RepID=UPI001E38266E|nr:tail fiber protein [Xanthomonas vesicatoria]MCC8628119.1 tail fiber protein [Xanthomonas vesicatoria]MDG4483224.1 phage tail protein [Xanthomonas vesicatoria]